MSRKSSLPQDVKSVSVVLTPDNQVSSNSIFITLAGGAENKTIIGEALFTRNPTTRAEKNKSDGFVISDRNIIDKSVSFLPDYIRIQNFDELILSRYYKNDWHGIFVSVNNISMFTQTLTLNCRDANDKLSDALKAFTEYKERK
jgi:hypothetical protein